MITITPDVGQYVVSDDGYWGVIYMIDSIDSKSVVLRLVSNVNNAGHRKFYKNAQTRVTETINNFHKLYRNDVQNVLNEELKLYAVPYEEFIKKL